MGLFDRITRSFTGREREPEAPAPAPAQPLPMETRQPSIEADRRGPEHYVPEQSVGSEMTAAPRVRRMRM